MKKIIIFTMFILVIAGNVFALTPAINGLVSFPGGPLPAPIILALPAPTWVDAVVLTANSAATYTVPSTAKYLLFSSSVTPVYINFTTTAAIPGTSVATGAASLIGPVLVNIGAVTSVSLICPTAAVVSIAVFK